LSQVIFGILLRELDWPEERGQRAKGVVFVQRNQGEIPPWKDISEGFDKRMIISPEGGLYTEEIAEGYE
jgi:16S rRNA U1498 N3-methylase RsmE